MFERPGWLGPNRDYHVVGAWVGLAIINGIYFPLDKLKTTPEKSHSKPTKTFNFQTYIQCTGAHPCHSKCAAKH